MIEPEIDGSLYLELLKKTLTFLLWPEPGDVPMDRRIQGRLWPAYADTMIGLPRLNNIQYCVETILTEQIPGDLIETGVWRGGATIFMRAMLKAHDVKDRQIIVADSFCGLPEPDVENYPADANCRLHQAQRLRVSRSDVEENFRKYDLLDDQVVFLEGFFKDTLPSAPVDQLAILRLDGDMYSSTTEALDNLYPKLASGGFCIIDDYALRGCRLAVHDYIEKNQISVDLKTIDHTGRYWRKE